MSADVWTRRQRVVDIVEELRKAGVPEAATKPVVDWLVLDVLADPVAAVHFARLLNERACICPPDDSPCLGDLDQSCVACTQQIASNPDAMCINDPEAN